MEQTNTTSCKFILNTYEKGDNHYEDTTFNLRVPFRPNSNNQYRVTINEIFFRNNEATIVGGKDYFEFRIYITNSTKPGILRFRHRGEDDTFTYQERDKKKIMDELRAICSMRADTKEPQYTDFEIVQWFDGIKYENYPKKHDEDGKIEYVRENFLNNIVLSYVDQDGKKTTYQGVYEFQQKMGVTPVFNHSDFTGVDEDGNPIPVGDEREVDSSWVDNIYKIEMSYTDNWGYVLNNMNLVVEGLINDDFHYEDDEDEEEEEEEVYYKYADFWFYNLRINGPYIYVVDTPLTSTVNTYNANNEGYNIVALCYNTCNTHNSAVQMTSSMECTTNDLSNFRVRLLNDQFDPVPIHEPMYIQITVDNTG